MVSFAQLQAHQQRSQSTQYQCQVNVNLYKSPALQGLVTQAAAGRQLRLLSQLEADAVETSQKALEVCLCEDDYPGWFAIADLQCLTVAEKPYRAIVLSESDIRGKLPDAIALAQTAMTQPNQYLWGGTVSPNYDCSGLVQTVFAAVGIWLPRDAYQQEAFTQAIVMSDLIPGDLVLFGSSAKATHVGLYLGDGCYIHSSGKDQGRNGIGIDRLSSEGDTVSRTYYAQLRGAGRIVRSYQPQ